MYDFFNNSLSADCSGTVLDITPIPIGDILILKKRSFYISNTIHDAMPVAYEISVITLTTPYDSPKVIS